MEKNYDIGKKNQLEVEINYNDDYEFIEATFTYKFGKSEMTTYNIIIERDDRFNDLYTAIYNETYFTYEAGARLDIIVNHDEVNFHDIGLNIKIPIENTEQAFGKVYEAYVKYFNK